MSVINDHRAALVLVICLSLFSFFADAMPASIEKDENKADAQDEIRFRRPIKFQTVSDFQRFKKESEQHRKKTDQNGAVNVADRTLFRDQRAKPNVEPKDEDEETFNIEVLFFPWQSNISDAVYSERQIAQNGIESLPDQTFLREQHASPKIEPGDHHQGAFGLDRMLNIFWPRSEKKELIHEAQPAGRIGATKFVDSTLLGNRAESTVGKRESEEGVFNLDRVLNLFWPPFEKKELEQHKNQDDQNGAMKFVDHTLLRGQRAAPNVEARDNEDVFNLDGLLDFFWPQSENTQTLLRGQRAAPNVEQDNEEGVFNLNGLLDFFWPQSERKAQHLIREQRNVAGNEPWNNEGAMKLDQQDLLWPHSLRIESQDYDTEQVDRNGDVHFTDHNLLGRPDIGPYVEPRDTEEGALEPTAPPKPPADITYESNVLYYFLTITLPSFIGISLSIILCCFCLRINGYCCRLFDARPPDLLEEDANDFGQDNRAIRKSQVLV